MSGFLPRISFCVGRQGSRPQSAPAYSCGTLATNQKQKNMKIRLAILLLATLLSSCEKKKDLTLVDDIYYSQIISNYEFNSVRTYSSQINPNCLDIIPIPIDSIVEFYLDLDSDLKNDYKITVQHGRYYNVSTGHCAFPSTYLISIDGLDGTMVAMDSTKFLRVLQMDSLALISTSLSWKKTGYIKMVGDAPGLLADYIEIKKKYIGLKFQNKFAWLKFEPIDINGIKIVEYAFNKTEGNSIQAGQLE
jgi:hypothetical protein